MSTSDALLPSEFIDSDSPSVVDFARNLTTGYTGELDRILRLYEGVRDGIVYDPYLDFNDAANYRASDVLNARRGFCIGKSALLAACARAIGVPARVGYADVRNHLTSPRLYERLKTDVFIWHSYTALYVFGSWVKATPAFDSMLCQRLGLAPLEFDGRADSLFHAFDRDGRRHMEYIRDRGMFTDVPFATIRSDFQRVYPGLAADAGVRGDFSAEAVAAEAQPSSA